MSHFRTRNGDREVDFIIHRGGSDLVAVEVKPARTVTDNDVRHLLWLKRELGHDMRHMVMVYSGTTAYRRRDGSRWCRRRSSAPEELVYLAAHMLAFDYAFVSAVW